MALAGYADRPHVIGEALRDCEALEHPPTLPRFKALCAQRATQQRYVVLNAPKTDPAVARERLSKLQETAGFAQDPLFWAKRPKSAIAADELRRGARGHSQLREILADHVASQGAMCRSDEAMQSVMRGGDA